MPRRPLSELAKGLTAEERAEAESALQLVMLFKSPPAPEVKLPTVPGGFSMGVPKAILDVLHGRDLAFDPNSVVQVLREVVRNELASQQAGLASPALPSGSAERPKERAPRGHAGYKPDLTTYLRGLKQSAPDGLRERSGAELWAGFVAWCKKNRPHLTLPAKNRRKAILVVEQIRRELLSR